ncbi:MAG: TonB-dependent receptor, partial [Gemmatimonadaceae bacterium]|nr:TonB-dependent receptor [Chitinophagaceae bacterium]
TLKGKIVDTAAKQPLALATVTIFKAADTALITYRLSNPDGEFRVPSLPFNTECRVVISFSGYAVYRKTFTLTQAEPQLDLATIAMTRDAASLDEVLVIAERPPVSVRKDTIEFNAESFKTLPAAFVEDLLKKLPGVEVASDGSIRVNGKKVSRIMVDGKEFFGNDPTMATRNLPANIIDKIQVSQDKEEKDLNPDKPESEIGQVINLKLKKAIKKGWFGKVYAGGGTESKYEAGGILNLFRDTMQVSILGFGNNINKAGFSMNDVRSLGGFDRSGINSIWMNQNGGLNVNGISFGGMGEGIVTSAGGGFNMNHVLKNGLTLNTQYFYGQSKSNIEAINNRQQFIGDSVLDTRTNRRGINENQNNRIAFSLRGKLDSLTRIEFKPSFTIGDQENAMLTDVKNIGNRTKTLSASDNNLRAELEDLNYNHSFMYLRSYRKKGRSLNITNNFNFGRNENDQFNIANNEYYNISDTVRTTLDQLRNRDQQNLSNTVNINYTEPISKEWSLRLGGSSNFVRSNDAISTFLRDMGSGKYEEYVDILSSDIKRSSWRNTISPGINWKNKSWNITATANLQFLNISNDFRKQNLKANQDYRYLLPGLNINYKQLYLNYSANIVPPSVTDIQPVPDNTNPLNIVYGNPDLKPTTNHSLSVNFFKSVPATSFFISHYSSVNLIQNAIIRNRTVNADGSQISIPQNVNGNFNLYSNLHVTRQFKLNPKFQFTAGMGYNVDFSRNYLIVNKRESYSENFNVRPAINAGLNWKDKIEWNINHSRGFGGTSYSNPAFSKLSYQSYGFNSELVVRWPKHIVWETNINYRNNPGLANGIQQEVTIWNAGVTALFLKDDRGQLKLSVFDLLDQNIQAYRTSFDNGFTDSQTSVLRQFWMLTFTYNIRNFKGGKVGGSQRNFFFF